MADKKILMIGLTPPLEGGSETHIFELSKRIPEVTVLTQNSSNCSKKISCLPNIKSNFIRNISFFISTFIYSLHLTFFSKKRYNIIHIHENLLYFLAPLLSFRYKIIITVHGISGFRFFENKLLWIFFKFSLKFADKIVSVSLADYDLLANSGLKNLYYIPNGVDVSLYKSINSTKLRKTITFVGRIHKQKGLETLFQAFSSLPKEFSKYSLEIIGNNSGDYYEFLKNKYGSKRVSWTGFISDRKKLFSLMSSSRLLVFPSMWEALPWPALLEGLASGRPVIASNLKGMNRVFSNGSDLLLFTPGDSQELLSLIINVLKNDSLSIRLGKNGKMIAKKFSWENSAKALNRVYSSLMSTS